MNPWKVKNKNESSYPYWCHCISISSKIRQNWTWRTAWCRINEYLPVHQSYCLLWAIILQNCTFLTDLGGGFMTDRNATNEGTWIHLKKMKNSLLACLALAKADNNSPVGLRLDCINAITLSPLFGEKCFKDQSFPKACSSLPSQSCSVKIYLRYLYQWKPWHHHDLLQM